jgi:hypothetical protein
MKVFLRNTQTGWFYQGPSQWTPDQASALNLEQVSRAVAQIFEAHLENVEILLSYDDPRYDLVLPVPPSPSQVKPTMPSQPASEDVPGEAAKPPMRHKKGPRL